MDGFHDMGGRQGFGRVVYEGKQQPFKTSWDLHAASLMGRLVSKHVFNMDEYRHAVERMEAKHYVAASYFERTLVAVTTLCVEKGFVSAEELGEAVGSAIPLARPSQPGRTTGGDLPALEIGDFVVVKSDYVGGHIRLPGYIRGKRGQIVGQSSSYPFPDAAAHGLEAPKQCTFDVRFQAHDLWGEDCDDADVHVGVFHSYLTKASIPNDSKDRT